MVLQQKMIFLLVGCLCFLMVKVELFAQEDYDFVRTDTWEDVDGNVVVDSRFTNPVDPSSNVSVQTTLVGLEVVNMEVCIDAPDPKTVSETEFDWSHIKTLALKKKSSGGLVFSGGHLSQANFPSKFTIDGVTYTVTYSTNPATPNSNKPYKVTATVKKNGMPVTVSRKTWDVFPENWTESQMKAAVRQAWGAIKPTLGNDDAGGVNVETGGGIKVELKWSLKSFKENGEKKWKLVISTAYPKG